MEHLERKEITFRIFRYNPEVDARPFYDDVKISLEKGITILRALNFIKDTIDASLTYRFFCQAGICGSCAMRINGVSKLACTTQVWDELDKSKENDVITIEPLNNLSLIRDMVVDIDPVFSKLERYSGWTVPKVKKEDLGKKECIISEEDFSVYEAATDCILCASCYSECSLMEVNRGFISPLVMLKAFRHNSDERDVYNDERLKELVKDGGIWDCTHCYRCVEHCVKNIPIMDGIQYLRHETFSRKMPSSEGKRHALAFMQDIPAHGRLNESTLPLRTKGPFYMLKILPQAVQMFLKNRVPPLLPHKIPGIKNVRNMFREIEKQGNKE